MNLTRRSFLFTLPAAAVGQRTAKKPNVVLIVADDLGYGDIPGTDVPTPNIDSIAKNGVRFTSGYVSCPVCSPTRAGLMTGRYQTRFGHEFNPGPPNLAEAHFGLPLNEKAFPAHMKELGYATGMAGKWHLGYKPEYHPMKRGFDEFFGFLGGAHSYLDANADKTNPIMRGSSPVDEKEYLTDAFTREALAFIDKSARKQPFFLYLAYNAVHGPMHASEPRKRRFESITDPVRQTYATMLAALDDGVGQVLEKLRERQIENDTLIVFVGDNGGPTPVNTSKNTPLRATKGTIYEGGIRVPFAMQWKSVLPKGKVYEQPVIALDLLPTAITAAGGKAPGGMDGVDLTPYLSGKRSGSPHDTLYWRFGLSRAIRRGDWKLLTVDNQNWELYNLRDDISETNNLAASQPDRVSELKAAYETWNAQQAEPRWKGNQTRRIRTGSQERPARVRRRRQ
jgi:arylsulfatase A-like enzyme